VLLDFLFLVVYTSIGLLIGWQLLHARDQMPWLVLFFGYVIVGGIFGTWFLSKGRAK
jgi:hypothetical protein